MGFQRNLKIFVNQRGNLQTNDNRKRSDNKNRKTQKS